MEIFMKLKTYLALFTKESFNFVRFCDAVNFFINFSKTAFLQHLFFQI